MLNLKTFRALMLSLLAVCIVVQLPPLLRVSAQTSIESDFMAILNAERATLGKNHIAINSCLSTASHLHSEDMAEQVYFSHTSLDGRTFDQRIIAAGYTDYVSLGENIAYTYGAPDAAKVYEMWKNSSGHYANMMGNFNEAGLGVYSKNGYTYYTLDLGKSRSVTPPTPSPTPTPTPTLKVTPTPTPTDVQTSPKPIPTETPSNPTPTPSAMPTSSMTILPPEVFYASAILGASSVGAITVFALKRQKK